MPAPDDHPYAELAALADGTLPPRRRAALEARVAESPELAEALERQRSALAALRAVEARAPEALRARIAGEASARAPRRRWLRPPVLAGGFALAAVVLIVALLLPGGAAAPTVVEAAELGALPAQAAAPADPDEPALLATRTEGLAFPDWAAEFGWRATGRRVDSVGGRRAVTVFYEKEGRRIAYTILSGEQLPTPEGAEPAMRDGLRLHSLSDGRRVIVTWPRDGHTCVLSGLGADAGSLLDLAAWKGQGAVAF